MNLGNKEPIAWVTSKTGKTNPMKLKRKAISPDGNVVEISLANGKAADKMLGNTYAQLIQYEKERKNWVWYDSFDDEKAREALIASRQATKRASHEEYLQLFQTKLDKLTEVLEKSMVGDTRPKLSDDQLAEVMTAQPKERKSK